eukprot:1706410-Lingulodinium_polyedra.AAC.1
MFGDVVDIIYHCDVATLYADRALPAGASPEAADAVVLDPAIRSGDQLLLQYAVEHLKVVFKESPDKIFS